MTKFLLFLILTTIAFSCEPPAVESAYDRALKIAQRENKSLLLDFTATWCGGCKAYDKYVFANKEISDHIKNNYALLKIDADDPNNIELMKRYEIIGLPHIIMTDAQGKMLGGISGFDRQLVNHPEQFLESMQLILQSMDEIKDLEANFQADTTDLLSVTNLLNAYREVGRHVEVQKLKKLLVQLMPTEQNLFDDRFDQALQSLKNGNDPQPMLSIIEDSPSLSAEYLQKAHSELLHHYERFGSVAQQDHCYQELLNINPGYYSKNYARFLFENSLKTDFAIHLTDACLEDENLRNDHWGQFLLAHSRICQGDTTQAVSGYSRWMEQIKDRWESGDTYWPLVFHARFANFYNLDLQRALDYLTIAEEHRNMIDEKLLMAQLLQKLHRSNEPIQKLEEALLLTEDQIAYQQITETIESYKKGDPELLNF